MTDAAHASDPMQKPWLRILAWACAACTLLAVAVALFAAPAAGWHGFLLIAGVAGVAFALMFALLAGESAGRALQPPAFARRARTPVYAEAAFEYAPDALLVTDARGGVRVANVAYRALAGTAGWMGESARPPGVDRLFGGAPAVGAAIFRLKRAARAGDPASAQLPPLNLNGEVRQLLLEARPLPFGDTLWRLSGRDTGGPVAPLIADPAEDYADAAPVGLFAYGPDGAVSWMNRTMRDWLGVPADARIALKDFVISPPPRTLLRRGGGPARFDATLRARDGIETPVVIVSDWPDNGRVSRSVVYGFTAAGAPQAVTQALGGELEAGRSFDDMFASAPFGVARLDRDTMGDALIEDANQTLLSLTGGRAQPGVRFADLFARDEGAPLTLRGDEPAEATLAGEPPREAHVYVWRDRRGRAVAYVVDVSRWKELERQLVQSQKMQAIGQLAGGVAHDFNNLLTAIRGNCDLLLERHPVGDPAYPELQQINSVVARAAGLVRKLLAFSRKQTFRAELLDVTDVISDFSVLMRQVLEETVKVEIAHGRALPMIRADKGQMETALMNLATNARDAMREKGGGTLTIRTAAAGPDAFPAGEAPETDGEFLLIEVSDTGMGMSPEVRAKVFEPFFTTKEPGKGTGLGLATVYGIVKQSGGYLYVDSEPGKGTTFRIFLPAARAEAQERQELEETVAKRAQPKAPASLSGRGRILLVEDEDAVRQIAAKTLIKRGYEVLEAEDGEAALEIAKEYSGRIDLMISDVVMPGLDGPGLLRAAKEHLGSARVIFISGYAQEEFSDVLSENREVSFLPKPFTLLQLAERVKEMLGE